MTLEIPVDGSWSDWSDWNKCTQTCGGGTQLRVRLCNEPEPRHGGRDCGPDFSESRGCNTDPCECQNFYLTFRQNEMSIKVNIDPKKKRDIDM